MATGTICGFFALSPEALTPNPAPRGGELFWGAVWRAFARQTAPLSGGRGMGLEPGFTQSVPADKCRRKPPPLTPPPGAGNYFWARFDGHSPAKPRR